MGYSGSTEMFKTNNPINLGEANARPFKYNGRMASRMFYKDGSTEGKKSLTINPKVYASGGLRL